MALNSKVKEAETSALPKGQEHFNKMKRLYRICELSKAAAELHLMAADHSMSGSEDMTEFSRRAGRLLASCDRLGEMYPDFNAKIVNTHRNRHLQNLRKKP